MKTITALRAAGDTHPGRQREVNEDRFHVDPVRGLFIVVDGVGGQAAGGKAADTAMRLLRARLERDAGTVADRIREAIVAANNEIHRVASLRAEWHGMACVLTVAVVEDGRVTIGHVGDTRLYKLRRGRIEKATRDHSPVGEREDAREITEREAMRHPRRNEVYRDVGSEPHAALDPDFIDLFELPFEPDAALLLCSDGLTDLIDSTTIGETARRYAGHPDEVVAALIEAANDAGGKDNVTVVYVEGEEFAVEAHHAPLSRSDPPAPPARAQRKRMVARFTLVALIGVVIGFALLPARLRERLTIGWTWPAVRVARTNNAGQIVVTSSESIAAALARAQAGDSLLVEPGEYRERLVMASGVRIISRIPRAATLRLPSTASEGDPAVVADDVSGAELNGFRIVGDAATPLGTGIFVKNAEVSIVDVEISGAANAAIDLSQAARPALLASHIHDNPGTALAIRGGASPRVNQNIFSRNGLSSRSAAALTVEADAQPTFFGNVFHGIGADTFRALGDAAAERVARDNVFVAGHETPNRGSTGARGRRDR